VQGHPRSLLLVPIANTYDFLLVIIVTLALSRTVSKIQLLIF